MGTVAPPTSFWWWWSPFQSGRPPNGPAAAAATAAAATAGSFSHDADPEADASKVSHSMLSVAAVVSDGEAGDDDDPATIALWDGRNGGRCQPRFLGPGDCSRLFMVGEAVAAAHDDENDDPADHDGILPTNEKRGERFVGAPGATAWAEDPRFTDASGVDGGASNGTAFFIGPAANTAGPVPGAAAVAVLKKDPPSMPAAGKSSQDPDRS